MGLSVRAVSKLSFISADYAERQLLEDEAEEQAEEHSNERLRIYQRATF